MLLPEEVPQDVGGPWSPVAPDDEVWAPPSANEMPPPPVATSPDLLPTHELSWENFERLVYCVAKVIDGGTDFRMYGKRGQAQHGIDFVGFFHDGRLPTVYQAKRHQEFSEGALEEAVQKYADGRRPFGANRLVVAVACEATDTKIVEKLHDLWKAYPHLTIDLWDRVELSEALRVHTWMVDRFFGRVWRSAIAGGEADTLSQGMGIEVDAVLRGPIRHLGLADEMSNADEEMGTNPRSAAGRFDRIANRLEESPFMAYAVRFRRCQAQALQEAGDLVSSARVRLDAAWKLVDYADLWMARTLLIDMDPIEAELPEDLARSVEMLDAVVAWRLNFDRNFEHLVEAVDESQKSDPHRDRAALAFAEEAIAYRRFELVRDRAPSLLNIAAAQTQDRAGQLVSARLRCCVADATRDWRNLSNTARQVYEMPIAALVHARHGRFLALNKEPDRAKERYLDAIQFATLESNSGDAADWLYSLRDVHFHYDEFPSPERNDLHYHAQALRAYGEARVLPSVGARIRAHAGFSSGKWQEALEALRQYIWHSTVTASWNLEKEAHKMLGDLFVETNQYPGAVSHYIYAGAGDRAKDLAGRFPEETLEFPPSIQGSPKWERAAAFSLVAALADSLADEDAQSWASVALQNVVAIPPAVHWGNDVYQASAEAFASVAELATKEDAIIFMQHVDENPQYLGKLFRDKAIVKALFGIARSYPNLRTHAVSLVLDVLLRSGDLAHMIDWLQGRDVLSKEKQTVQDKVENAARSGNTTACLVLIDAECNLSPVTEHAKPRLEKAIATSRHQPTKPVFGTTFPQDGALMHALDQRDKGTFVEAMLRVITETKQPLQNKQEALMATAWLVRDLPKTHREQVFSVALDCARGERYNDGPKHPFNWASDPLDRGQSDFGPENLQAEGLFCAARSAASNDQVTKVWKLAIRLLQEKDDLIGYRTARSMTALPSEIFAQDIAMLSSHSNRWARCVAAAVWAAVPSADPEIGRQLAGDHEQVVRRWLASSLQDVPKHESVREMLSNDPRRSVRRYVAD